MKPSLGWSRPSFGASLFVLSSLLTSACGAASSVAPPASAALVVAPHGDEALAAGTTAPDFSTIAHDGAAIRLSALKGNEVVLFFYSKDDAPGPTREASAFRDAWDELARRGVVVIGISTDTLDAHKEFAQHLHLPFHLVSDSAGHIAQAYGVPNTYGVLDRDTVVIGADGKVRKVYRSVDVAKHVAEVLSDLES